jgi:hypothetical protein
MRRKGLWSAAVALALLAVGILATGCSGILAPSMSYQGRLTDASGTPLNGTVDITIRLYHSDTGGTPFYTEPVEDVTVTDGLFDIVFGPSSLGTLGADDLTRAIWMEVEIDDGTHSETLTPRQRLLAAPYAMTLMAGTTISGTMDSIIFGSYGLTAILNIQNSGVTDAGNHPLPALRLVGERPLELVGVGDETGRIYSEIGEAHSDLAVHTHDEFDIYLDDDDNSTSSFTIHEGGGGAVLDVNEAGDLVMIGDLQVDGDFNADGSKSAIVPTDDYGERLLYALESPEVWFEDFGTAALIDGEAVVELEAIFAQTVNLSGGYHVFLTPLGDCNGLYVAEKTAASFTVRELGGGTASLDFDYRVVAKRLGYEDLRLEEWDGGEGSQ